MRKLPACFITILSLIVGGCSSETGQTSPDQTKIQTAPTDDPEKGHTHSHEGDDVLVWDRDHQENEFLISLGRHGIRVHDGHEVEPAVSITRDGRAVADAKVYNSLISVEEGKELAAEVPTVYEPETESEPAHYAQGKLSVPKGLERVIIQ